LSYRAIKTEQKKGHGLPTAGGHIGRRETEGIGGSKNNVQSSVFTTAAEVAGPIRDLTRGETGRVDQTGKKWKTSERCQTVGRDMAWKGLPEKKKKGNP